ncbi:MAG: serine/threonine-protein kinase [Dokdonella sp.]
MLRELFERAVLLAAEARARFLDLHCPDPLLRSSVERLLAADIAVDTCSLAGGADAAALAIGDIGIVEALPPGTRIGPFELIEVLGEGGSSTVFRAVRDVEGVRQEVALKLLRRGLYSPDARRQFRRERQALAQLRHPGIARLVEGGVTENGLAFIALELVDGQPLTAYAREHRLDLRRRLALFQLVCRAVEAAHRAMIVHRDLKPSNVLVTDDGEVKLLDFGIAKLLDADDELQTQFPAFTPAYAAPEQRTGAPVTAATDVYALGILLGELITGQRLNGGTGSTPSSQVQQHNEPGVLPAPTHITRRALRGDLDTIVLAAIDPEPQRRYGTAGALADDIERLLAGHPVVVHPTSTWYRARKFVSRHRVGVATTALFLLAIMASLGIALVQAGAARTQARRADAARDFIVGLLRNTAPDTAAKDRPDVPALVYSAASTLPHELQDQPALRAELLYTLGDVLRDMRDFPRSEALLRLAETAGANLSQTSPIRIGTEIGLARTLIRLGNYPDAETHLAPLLLLPERALPVAVPRAMLLKIAMTIADGRGDMIKAVAFGRQMLTAFRADCTGGHQCDALASATHDLASVLVDADLIAEARPLADEALQRKQGDRATPSSIANTIELQAKIDLYRGDLDAAKANAAKADHLLESLGNGLTQRSVQPREINVEALLIGGDAAEAESQLEAILADQRTGGANLCDVSWTELSRARAALLLRRVRDAETMSSQALADAQSCTSELDRVVNVAIARLVHGQALAAKGDVVAADAEYARAMGSTSQVHAANPLFWPLFLIESVRLARSLGHSDAAARQVHDLVAALDRADALPSHTWRAEVGSTP